MVPAQSATVQQSLSEMHELVFVHTFSPPGHAHVPPGAEQISPGTGQSPLLQQVPLGIHVPLAMHAVMPVPHISVHIPLLHTFMGGQTMPQPPQLFGSLPVLAQ